MKNQSKCSYQKMELIKKEQNIKLEENVWNGSKSGLHGHTSVLRIGTSTIYWPGSMGRLGRLENYFVALGTDVTLIWNEEIIISATLISLSFIISTSVKKPIR